MEAGVRTRVDVGANGYDTRTSDDGCSPNGCVPPNTRDVDLRGNSRWSCQGDILDNSDDDGGCCITYYFEELQDIFRMRVAFHKGDENTRTLDVFDNGDHHSKITSSGSTRSYQIFYLYTDETKEMKLCLDDSERNTDVWLSITEVGLGKTTYRVANANLSCPQAERRSVMPMNWIFDMGNLHAYVPPFHKGHPPWSTRRLNAV